MEDIDKILNNVNKVLMQNIPGRGNQNIGSSQVRLDYDLSNFTAAYIYGDVYYSP